MNAIGVYNLSESAEMLFSNQLQLSHNQMIGYLWVRSIFWYLAGLG